MFIERTLKASLVIVIPFLFALLAGLVLLGITVARELTYKFNNVFSLTTNDTILFALKLVDAVLIVNLSPTCRQYRTTNRLTARLWSGIRHYAC